MKRYLSIIAVAFAVSGLAQTQPIITGVDKKFGTANEVVTITGAGFVSTPIVYFGTGKSSSVTFVNANQIQALVPASATSGPITVINQNGPPRLSATSSSHFSIAFDHEDGENSYSLGALGTAEATGTFSYDVCLCDFNSNGLLDVVVTNDDAPTLNVLRNNSNTSSIAFIEDASINNSGNTSHNAECSDLNGDGFPDLVVTSQGSGEPFVHIYQNTSTADSPISFTIAQTKITLPVIDGGAQRLPKRIRLVDIDGDGRKDIVVGSFTVSEILVYLNTSTAAVSFSTTPTIISIDGAINAGSLYPGDFDNDGRVDLVAIPTGETGQIFIVRNQSLPGDVRMSLQTTFGNQRLRNNVVTGDFNNDGFVDIAATNSTSNGVDVYENQGGFSFSEDTYTESGSAGWGLDVGDMNGDGLTDIIVASTSNEIIYFENTSTTSSVNFNNGIAQPTNGVARNVKAGDLNQDGKPDLAFIDESTNASPGEFNYIINDLCMTPVITPINGIFCDDIPFIVRATGGENVTYTWSLAHNSGASSISVAETDNEINLDDYLDAPLIADIQLSVNASVIGTTTCDASGASETYTYTLGPGGSLSAPTMTDPDVCYNEAFTLTSPNTGFNQYYWSGPNNFSATTTTASVVVSANATYEMSGTYELIVFDGSCNSPVGSIDIVISGPPVTTIESADCDAGTVTMEVPDFSSQYTYQWNRGGTPIGGATGTSHSDSQTGVYTLDITETGCTYTTDPFEIYASSFSGPSFGATDEVCTGVETTFDANQTGSGIENSWEVEDPSNNITTFSGDQLVTTFGTSGSWEVRLLSTYSSPNNDGVGCSSKTITVSDPPSFEIDASVGTISAGNLEKCPSEVTTLSMDDAGIVSYVWDDADGTSGPLVDISEPGTYTATYTTDTGCEETATITITNLPDLGLTADGNPFVDGSAQLGDGEFSMTLAVDAGVTNVEWVIPGISPNPTTNSVTITPTRAETLITVSGQTADGCDETQEVTVLSNIIPAKSFSPNGDGTRDCWTIAGTSFLNGCTVYVLDTRGRTVYKDSSPFADDCVWDGNFNGNEVPEGVYYFVMKCDDSSNNQSGSILLAR